MTVMVQTVDKDELRCRRARLLKRSGLSWPELRKRAEAYSLSDEQRSLYDTIRGIDWLLDKDR